VQPLRNAVGFAISLVPQRATRLDHALVHCDDCRIGQAFFDRQDSLQTNRFFKKPMRAAIAIEVGASGGELLDPQPLFQLAAMLVQIAVLGRLRLSSFQHRDHNKDGQNPVRNIRRSPRPRSRTLPLRLLAQRHGHLYQSSQTRAGLGMLPHPWDLQVELGELVHTP
jgi:hypothetical protein